MCGLLPAHHVHVRFPMMRDTAALHHELSDWVIDRLGDVSRDCPDMHERLSRCAYLASGTSLGVLELLVADWVLWEARGLPAATIAARVCKRFNV